MKSQSAFIPDNISAISNYSRKQFIHNPTYQPSQFHPDSTDNLVEEILMQRAQRLKNEQKAKQQQKQSEQSVKNQIHSEQEQKQQQEVQDKQELNLSKEQFDLGQRLNNHSKGTINQSSIKQKDSSPPLQDHIHTLHNQTNQYFQQNDLLQNKDNQDNLARPQIDHINNQSVSHRKTPSEKSLQLNLSLSPSQKRQSQHTSHNEVDNGIKQEIEHSSKILDHSKQLISQKKEAEYIQPLKANPSSNASKSYSNHQKVMSSHHSKALPNNDSKDLSNRLSQHGSNNSKSHIQANNSRSQLSLRKQRQDLQQSQMVANQSKIEVKNSLIVSPINIYTQRQQLDFTPIPKKKESDMELVKAITEHLNTIEHEESSHQRTIRKSQRNINTSQNVVKRQQVSQVEAVQYAQQFQTDQSQYVRQRKIMEHRLQSNMLFQIGQLKQMIALYEALILNEECKESIKEIKDLQMKNRRQKIALRSASYTKRFNFHSPIPKNNDRPIQFKTKFVISPRLAGNYHQAKKNIEEEKKLQGELEEKYTVLNDYYEMMKQKKIQVNIEGLTEYQYNSKIMKYETVKGNFFKRQISPSFDKSSSQYQFNKSKRTLSIEDNQVTYYQILKYKLEIGKDMMLQFQVWNLGKLKKLKDQNILIKKQIEYINKQIHDIDRQLLNLFGISSVKSTSKSPSSRNQIVSPIKSQSKFKRPETAFTSKKDDAINNSFKDYDLTGPKKQSNKKVNGQLLLLQSVKMDPSKRKSMQILKKIDDYGMSAIEEESKIIDDNPTLVKKPSKLIIPKSKDLKHSKSKNLVKTRSKEVRTQTNLNKSGSIKSKDLKMSEHTSPKKVKAQSQYYTSMEQIYKAK